MSDEAMIPPRQQGQEWVHLIQAQYGGPAFIRRGKRLADAFQQLYQSLARFRQPDHEDDWLAMVRLRLGRLKALAGDWSQLSPWLPPSSISLLKHLEQQLSPRLHLPPAPDPRPTVLFSALRELLESIRRFNRRWLRYLQNLDLTPIQRLIDEYNRYYLLEKECFLQSPRLARLGFQPIPPLTWTDLLDKFPLIPEPQLWQDPPS
ncbi:hypothetical protein HRbin36_00458 [bacterium HR36]|nr:hypothetical protein HRbin36_00458 [bacterium HR36]